MLVFGGEGHTSKDISIIENCALKKHRELTFDFVNGGCAVGHRHCLRTVGAEFGLFTTAVI